MARATIPLVLGFGVLLCGRATAQRTERMSLSSTGSEGDRISNLPSISGDGRYVSFASQSTNLVPQNTNLYWEVYVRDRLTRTTEIISVNAGGDPGIHGESTQSSISSDARYVAFQSEAINLVPGDTNDRYDIFVRDRQAGTIERVSLTSTGAQANDGSFFPSISADGRYVAFHSYSTNLVPGVPSGFGDVYVRDRLAGTTERISVDSAGMGGNQGSYEPSISADGRFVAFWSIASDLVPGDTNTWMDSFVRDRLTGTTERISVDSNEVEGNDQSRFASISGDGRFVAFFSLATNLVPGSSGFCIYLRDRLNGTTSKVEAGQFPSISSEGRYVACGGPSGDVSVFDRIANTTQIVSVPSGGGTANGPSNFPSISADGRYTAFESDATNLAGSDSNGSTDVYLRDRTGGPMFTSLCEPGANGVMSCPCANPPGGPGRGCDNSSSTGGAMLFALGETYLSSDTLVFHTSGQRPTALAIVTQWSGRDGDGASLGMGVRCAQGQFKRLYSKSAVAGSITAPNFGSGDPKVSVRSAALGDPISPGQSRWYIVIYRDPHVLGGCDAFRTFNATPTGQVTWGP